MPVVHLPRRTTPEARSRQTKRTGRVYAIAFDLDTNACERELGDKTAAYGRIERIFARHGFTRQQGSLFFGTENSTPVDCVLAVQELDRRYAWFGRVVTDIRMLRVEEQNNLLPVLSSELRFDEPEADAG